MKREIWVKELVESLNESYRILGRTDRYVSIPSPIDQAEKESLSWCSKKEAGNTQVIRNSKAGVIVCPDDVEFSEPDYQDKTFIQVSNPRLTFIRLLQKHFTVGKEFSIHSTAVIDEKAKIDPHIYIGPHCYIGECEIGEGTIIYGNVYIYPGTKIGRRVIIHAGTVIGADGFGFERNEEGKLERFPHIGGVVIEDDVEIGSNVSIDRGALTDTIIGEGTKVDNLVQIAHGVKIGKHCVIVDLTSISGSVKIGDYSWIAPQVCVKEDVTIGSRVMVGMGSVVIKDIGDNLVAMGIPARTISKNIPET